jgi:hypothetical protein
MGDTRPRDMHTRGRREIHARALFLLRYSSVSDPGCDARPEALTTPAEEDNAKEE